MTKLLSDYFEQIAYKKLSAVEADAALSNQHEFNGIGDLKEIFGTKKIEIEVVQIYLNDKLEEPIFAKSKLTWYDAREKHPSRTEYRLYYKSSSVTNQFKEGDLMIFAKRSNGQFLNLFAEQNSSAENQLKLLFGITEITGNIETHTIKDNGDVDIDSIRNFIIGKLGIIDETVMGEEGQDYLSEMIKLFPQQLPSTKEFSEFARSTIKVDGLDADTAIMEWWNRETFLFKLYEKYHFDARNDKGQNDIDSFIKLSLTIQNTRKARAGSALENHTEQIFINNNVIYSRTPVTENNSKPDFIFPSIEQYRDKDFPESRLHMLAIKTSCKDRWRQVLPEASRIPHKHLLTLEPGISKNQTDEMKFHNLTLVLPKAIHSSYNQIQQKEILTVGEFVEIVRSNQFALF